MTRQELEKWIGKHVHVGYASYASPRYYEGFFILHKNEDFYHVDFLNKKSKIDENTYLNQLNNCLLTISEIVSIIETPNRNCDSSIYEYFGHEVGDWLSKPIEQVSITTSHYPNICRHCNSPTWVNPVTGHTDCSNKDCDK